MIRWDFRHQSRNIDAFLLKMKLKIELFFCQIGSGKSFLYLHRISFSLWERMIVANVRLPRNLNITINSQKNDKSIKNSSKNSR